MNIEEEYKNLIRDQEQSKKNHSEKTNPFLKDRFNELVRTSLNSIIEERKESNKLATSYKNKTK
jgi:hypothetical protein